VDRPVSSFPLQCNIRQAPTPIPRVALRSAITLAVRKDGPATEQIASEVGKIHRRRYVGMAYLKAGGIRQ